MNENRKPPETAAPRGKRAFFALRAVLAFVLLAALCAGIYWAGYHAYPDVAEWIAPGDHSAIVYKGETYLLAGTIGKRGLTAKKYPADELLGELAHDDLPALTTAPPETDPPSTGYWETADPALTEDPADTEAPETLPPPEYDPTLPGGDSAFILYSVKDEEHLLLLRADDGTTYLYYREGTDNPADS